MSSLRVLLVNQDQSEYERIASVLSEVDCSVMAASDLREASQVLEIQKFDAVLLGSLLPSYGVEEFTAKLRDLEDRSNAMVRTPVLSANGDHAAVDAHLPHGFEAGAFASAVLQLSSTLDANNKSGPADLPVFVEEEFLAQVAFDRELAVEVIDLFLAECPNQLAEMKAALASHNYSQLGILAHTMKGSFSSLHAESSKYYTQNLEVAAKQEQEVECQSLLSSLEQQQIELAPKILAFRNASN